MKRVFGAVSGALRSLAPKATVPSVAHQERVRNAMEALAPKGRTLPSEGKALAMEAVAAINDGDKGISLRTPEEMWLAANALHVGQHIPQDKPAAVALWKKAAEAGHLKATYSYAGCLKNGEGGLQKDLVNAVSLFEKLSDAGLLEAKHALALVLSSGEGEHVGIPKDEERARQLFETAARGGWLPAIHAAASMIQAGQGGERNDAKAVQWLETALEAGDPMSISTLATWYANGRAGLKVDNEKAFKLHLQAANMGMPRAQFNTAVHYAEGTGIERNLPEAAFWFEKAGAGGMPQAMLNLGKMLEQGLGVPVDKERALKLFQAALRAEGQLFGEAAEAGDKTMAALYEAKEKGLLAEDEKGGKAQLRVESGKGDGHDRDEDAKLLDTGDSSHPKKVSA
ncbi:unnamed protein product [Scytosiphon promiscuus]